MQVLKYNRSKNKQNNW